MHSSPCEPVPPPRFQVYEGLYISISSFLGRGLLRTGLPPHAYTLIGFGCALAAASLFAVGTYGCMAIGFFCSQLAIVFDCLDGIAARRQDRCSRTGALLDTLACGLGDTLMLAGFTRGTALLTGGQSVWLWGLAAVSARLLNKNLAYAVEISGFGKQFIAENRHRVLAALSYSRYTFLYVLAAGIAVRRAEGALIAVALYGLVFYSLFLPVVVRKVHCREHTERRA